MNVTLQAPSNRNQVYLNKSFGSSKHSLPPQREKSTDVHSMQRRPSIANLLPADQKTSNNTSANPSRAWHSKLDIQISPSNTSTQHNFFRATIGSMPAVKRLARSLNASVLHIVDNPVKGRRRELFGEKLMAVNNANMSHHRYARDDFMNKDRGPKIYSDIEVSFPGLHDPPKQQIKPRRKLGINLRDKSSCSCQV